MQSPLLTIPLEGLGGGVKQYLAAVGKLAHIWT